MPAELMVILLCVVVVIGAYTHVFPKVAGGNVTRYIISDIIASVFTLTCVGYKYWGTGHDFFLLGIPLNWFWYTLIIYAILEIPIALWYCQKHGISLK